MFVDTHCHLTLMIEQATHKPFSLDHVDLVQNIIDDARTHGVGYLVTIGANAQESTWATELCKRYKTIFSSVGLHPSDCKPGWQDTFKKIKNLVNQHEHIVAVGESGLDFYHSGYHIESQEAAFRAHIELALHHSRALVIHSRNAQDRTLRILEEYKNERLRAVFHCFSESMNFAQEAVAHNYFLGFGGSITYPKNNQLREIAAAVPLENIVLETDAPFLPPQDFRGTQNHPRHIAAIGAYLARLRGINQEEIAQYTTANAARLFDVNFGNK